MKRSTLSLAAVLILAVQPIAAQQTNPAIAAYEDWKTKQQTGHPGVAMRPHYCLAAVSQRIDAGSARIDFYVVGKMSGLTLEIQPLKFEKLPSGEYKQENAGSVTVNKLGYQEKKAFEQSASMTVIVPVKADANSFAVKWSMEGSSLQNNTLVGKLDVLPTASVMGITTN